MSATTEPLEPTKRPDFFYKYRPLGSDLERQRLLQIVETSKIYYASPASFNDPFDCKVPPVGSFDPYFLRYLIAAQNAKSDEDHAEVYWKFLAIGSRTETERNAMHADLSAAEYVEFKAFVERIRHKVNEAGVLSFSAINDNTLMWSHYADHHRGVCLGFSLEKWPEMKLALYPVTYSVQRLPLKFDEQSFRDGRLIQAIAYTKDQSWCYEQEWRVSGKAPGEFSFPSDALVGIVFGCMTSDADKARVRRAVVGRSHVVLYQARMKEKDFGLDILPC
jgi:hypothetical protein